MASSFKKIPYQKSFRAEPVKKSMQSESNFGYQKVDYLAENRALLGLVRVPLFYRAHV